MPSSSTPKLYSSARWKRARLRFLRANPLCVFCLHQGRTTAAGVVDHIIPHKGDEALIWDSDNWQALCAPCHDGAKKELERSGTLRGCDADGVPLDPGHHWGRR